MPAYEWIIADVDGCLTPEESVPWDLDHFWELAKLCRSASETGTPIPPMTFCTGRPQPYVEALMKLLDVRAPAVCEGGAVLYSLHDNYARYAPGVTEEKLLDLRAIRAFLETDVLPKHPDVVLQFGKEANLSVFSSTPHALEPVQEAAETFIANGVDTEFDIYISHFYLNISIEGVDKGTTLKALLKELNVDKAHTVGIGDTVGDIPLRNAVGFFACPANAHEALKAVADYVSPYPLLEGVLDILRLPELQQGRT